MAGSRRRTLKRQWIAAGGFYPSVMYGLTTTGPYFVTAAFAQGARLLRNDRRRMAGRLTRRITKRSKRAAK